VFSWVSVVIYGQVYILTHRYITTPSCTTFFSLIKAQPYKLIAFPIEPIPFYWYCKLILLTRNKLHEHEKDNEVLIPREAQGIEAS
jgi:hypothetical protein